MKRIDFGTTFSAAWEPFVKNLGPLAIGGLVVYLLTAVLGLILQKVAHGATGQHVSNILQFLVGTPLNVGLCGMCLAILRGRTANAGDVFNGFQKAGPAYIVAIVPAVILGVLGIVLIVPAAAAGAMSGGGPGAIIGTMMVGLLVMGVVGLAIVPLFALGYAAVADGMSGPDALQFAVKQGAANWVQIFLLLLVAGIVGGLATAVTCSLGLIVVMPWWMMIVSVAYMQVAEGQTHTPAKAPEPSAPAPAPAPTDESPAIPFADETPNAPPPAEEPPAAPGA
jgi:uncharacterized membrane protein